MALVVQKFGGTSVGSIERIKEVSKIIKSELDQNNQVVVVASAMAGVTDHLVNLSTQVSNLETDEQRMEYDAIVATGEKVSCGILALYLQAQGLKARSWQGWQIPIVTDEFFTKGKIKHIDTSKLRNSFANNEVPIVAGFQGICQDRVVTLGRGGSDTSAAALAAALKADRCDIYTDVDGVYTADPRIIPNARKLPSITFEEMLELASAGSKVVHLRAVEIAAKYGFKLRVLSSFSQNPGTDILNGEEVMESYKVTSIAMDRNISCWEIEAPQGKESQFLSLCDALEKNAISVNQLSLLEGRTLLILPLFENERIKSVLTPVGYHVKELPNLVQVSVIGIGVKADNNILQKTFKILASNGINIIAANTSGIRISFLIPESQGNNALTCLHDSLVIGH